jgi:TrmH family RNA methyltransferase
MVLIRERTNVTSTFNPSIGSGAPPGNAEKGAMNEFRFERNCSICRPDDPCLARLHQLRQREVRDRHSLFLIDGLRPVAQALQLQAQFESVIICPQLLTHPVGHRALRQCREQGIPIVALTPELYCNLSAAEEPQGIGAVIRQWWEPLHGIRPSRGLCWIAVESVQFPGNLGTMIRTSEAVGAAGLILIGDSADPYDPSTLRASMGALFNQRLVRTSQREFAEWKRRRQCTLVGTSLAATADYRSVAYPRPAILLMGSEKQGLSESMQALCDLKVRIPMVGRSDSLNVAVAAGLVLYELFYQRAAGRRPPST